MTERDALLRAVCENPDDDTPRLVYADWLQENGDEPRAEFIREQIAAATAGAGKARALTKRADELLTKHGQRWRAELPQEDGWGWGTEFVRGFVQGLRVTSDYPTLPEENPPDPAVPFAAAPIVMFEIAENTIRPWIPHLRQVRWLSLSFCPLTVADAAALCSPELGMRPIRFRIDTPLQATEEGAVELLRAHFGDVLEARIELVE